tara:strand:- start:2143 stop:2403 length:261 start_codon:yes stop_codon:yes gene_type:complete
VLTYVLEHKKSGKYRCRFQKFAFAELLCLDGHHEGLTDRRLGQHYKAMYGVHSLQCHTPPQINLAFDGQLTGQDERLLFAKQNHVQ